MTASLSVHIQQLGRGSRTYPGKRDFIVLDHAGNHARAMADGRPLGFYEDEREWSLDGSGLKPCTDEKAVPPVTACRKCYGLFRRGPLRCPYCSWVLERQSRTVEVDAGTLEEIKRERKAMAIEEWRAKVTGNDRRAKFEEFREIARAKGYKKSWPYVRYRVIFGHHVPKEWSQRV